MSNLPKYMEDFRTSTNNLLVSLGHAPLEEPSQDFLDYTEIMDSLGDLSRYSDTVLSDIITELHDVIDNRPPEAVETDDCAGEQSRQQIADEENRVMDMENRA